MIRILPSSEASVLLKRRTARLGEAEAAVAPILEAVRERGDEAVLEYTRRLDGFEGASVRLPESALADARAKLPNAFCDALAAASANIRDFAQSQLPCERFDEIRPGLRLGQIVRPLDTVAAYIPGGRYPLPSTLMMTVIPAQVARVPRIAVCCPRPSGEVLGTAAFLGVREVFQMGGAHAIAAFAYGTESVPRADRIVGPGNIYVAAAKKLLAGETGIDFIAGPTEILIIADDANPDHLAADMLAQAEHDTDAAAILLTTSRALGEAVASAIERQLASLPTAAVAREAIARNGAVILVRSAAEAADLANRFAPEHLSLHDASLLPAIRHAGSIFLGPFSPEAAGDYAAGPNHVLPTSGVARVRGGLSVLDYLKIITVQELDRDALAQLTPAIATLARAEGLEGHARSVEVRLG